MKPRVIPLLNADPDVKKALKESFFQSAGADVEQLDSSGDLVAGAI